MKCRLRDQIHITLGLDSASSTSSRCENTSRVSYTSRRLHLVIPDVLGKTFFGRGGLRLHSTFWPSTLNLQISSSTNSQKPLRHCSQSIFVLRRAAEVNIV